MTRTNCPTRTALADYALGNLPDAEIERVTDHLEACGQCEATVAELEDDADTFVEALQRPLQASAFAAEPEFEQIVAAARRIRLEPATFADAAEPRSEPIGQLGNYELLAKLAAGGMATVYRARHCRMHRDVALKLLPAHRSDDEASVSRFTREIEAVSRLNHPNIVKAHDAGEDQGMHYLVMELVDGVDLYQLVKHIGALDVADAWEIVRQAALGMQHAFEHGLVHRDIKPSNLLLSRDGQVKLLDLGLALWQSDGLWQEHLTVSGTVMGTLDYMAPEQADNSHDVDIRADIYSLGCTLYKLLTGRALFASSTFDTPVKKILAHATEDPPSICRTRGDVPPMIAELLSRMLAKDPADRPQTPGAVADILKEFAAANDLVALVAKCEMPPLTNHGNAAAEEAPVMLPRESLLQPAKDVSAGGRRFGAKSWPLLGFVLCLLGVVAGTLVFRTPHGELIIEADDDVRIEVTSQDNTITIVDTSSDRKLELQAGEYGIRLVDAESPFVLSTDHVVLRRGDRVVVSARFQRDQTTESKTPAGSNPRTGLMETPSAKLTPKIRSSESMPNPGWSKVVSATTIEDEIKAVRLELQQQLQGQRDLQGDRLRRAHNDLAKLAVLFGIVSEYDEAIRWKPQAGFMRDHFARGAIASKRGGKEVFPTVRWMLQELDLLLAGEHVEMPGQPAELAWDDICERSLLMQWMMQIWKNDFEAQVGKQADFQDHRERIQHHADLVAGIATVLLQDGMEDADDDDYRDFAKLLMQHSRILRQAAEQNDYQAAKQQVALISYTCSSCHDSYR